LKPDYIVVVATPTPTHGNTNCLMIIYGEIAGSNPACPISSDKQKNPKLRDKREMVLSQPCLIEFDISNASSGHDAIRYS